MVVHELRERLHSLAADIVFLQEVQGLHLHHASRHPDWPTEPQHRFLAAGVWENHSYGRNQVYDHGHHGNAILSRFPILHEHNQDVTHLRFERRGLLHCTVGLPTLHKHSHSNSTLHCVCVHLSLLGFSRQRQLNELVARLEDIVPPHAPLLIAGDFNDWSNRAHELLAERLGLIEAFAQQQQRPTRSFPAAYPMLRLDRIYQRGMIALHAQLHAGPPWSAISDHAALCAQFAVPQTRLK